MTDQVLNVVAYSIITAWWAFVAATLIGLPALLVLAACDVIPWSE